MKTTFITGMILGHKNLGEFDKVIHIYCRELGKIRVIAKGARKITSKFTGHLETLNLCQAQIYFGPKNIILTEISTIKNLKKIRNNFEKLLSALKIAEITNKVVQENQQLHQLNELLEEAIKHLSLSEKTQLITFSYLLKLLNKVGLIPRFKSQLLEDLKTNSFSEIEKINLSDTQQQRLSSLVVETLGNYLKSSDLITFTTPFTLSSLSISKSN